MKSWYQRYNKFLKSKAWKRIKRESARLHGYACILCSSKNHIHFHHLKYPKRFRKVSPSDVVPLCESCHRTFHKACKFYGFPATGIRPIEMSDIVIAYNAL